MPSRLRPTSSLATDAILVGDPGRSLLLAQELLEQPKMCNHARGLWGYSGRTPAGHELTVQATGMGGPSAAVVLADLAELGVRRAVRIGTCTGLTEELEVGDLICVEEAHAWGGPGGRDGEAVHPNPELSSALLARLGEDAQRGTVASLDTLHGPGVDAAQLGAADAADMQTAALFGCAAGLGVAIAAVLIVTETASGGRIDDEAEQRAAKAAGGASAGVLSP
jgi:uridine phosphorylase